MGNGWSLLSVLGFTIAVFSIIKPLLCVQDTSKDCSTSLGIESGHAGNTHLHLSASSFYHTYYSGQGKYTDLQPSNAQLNGPLAWCVRQRRRSADIWLKVAFNKTLRISGIATQGFVGVNDYFVRSYQILYSEDGVKWMWVMDGNETKEFSGNKNGVDTARNTFPSIINARYVKIIPLTFHIMICLRINLYGCIKGNFSKTKSVTPTATMLPSVTSTSSLHFTSPTPTSETTTTSTITPSHTKASTLPTPSSITLTPSPTHQAPTSVVTLASKTDLYASESSAHQIYDNSKAPWLPVPLVVGSSLVGCLVFVVLILLLVVRHRRQSRPRLKRPLSDQAELLVIEPPLDDATFQLDDKPICSCQVHLIRSASNQTNVTSLPEEDV